MILNQNHSIDGDWIQNREFDFENHDLEIKIMFNSDYKRYWYKKIIKINNMNIIDSKMFTY